MSLFVWYFGTDRRYEDVPHHTVMMGPRYGGLLHDIFDAKVLADDFSLYLYRPTATDPSRWRPRAATPSTCSRRCPISMPGLTGPRPPNPIAAGSRPISRRPLLPGLGKDHVVSSRLMTPVDFRDRLLSVKGAAFGMEPVITQLAWFRPHNKSEEVENLFIVGAGTHPGAGLPGVVSSAKILDKVVPHASTVN
jgi:phytoene desaturase